MFRRMIRIATYSISATFLFLGMNFSAQAAGVSSVLPNGGVNIALEKGTTLEKIVTSSDKINKQLQSIIELTQIEELTTATNNEIDSEEEFFENLVIAQVNNYVNVRASANEDSEIVGKLYNNCVGHYISEQDGFYEIESGSLHGFVKVEYCITGEAAIDLAQEIGTRIATVICDGLYVRQEPSLDASILAMIANNEDLVVIEENDEWAKVDMEEGSGWINKQFITLHTDFLEAESKEEEAKRLQKEEEARRKARQAAQTTTQTTQSSSAVQAQPVVITGDSEMGVAVAEYAVQFVGNPYKYGGTSLTNGADCSGFVMSVYANFGVSLPHSSKSDRTQGYAVDSLENAQPGDLICYSGHVALYIGNNQIVHASTAKTGIIISREIGRAHV